MTRLIIATFWYAMFTKYVRESFKKRFVLNLLGSLSTGFLVLSKRMFLGKILADFQTLNCWATEASISASLENTRINRKTFKDTCCMKIKGEKTWFLKKFTALIILSRSRIGPDRRGNCPELRAHFRMNDQRRWAGNDTSMLGRREDVSKTGQQNRERVGRLPFIEELEWEILLR